MDSQWKQTKFHYSFLTHFFPLLPFLPTGKCRKSFQELRKGNIKKKSVNRYVKSKTENLPFGEIWLFNEKRLIFFPKPSESFRLISKIIFNYVFKDILANLVSVWFVCWFAFFPLTKYKQHKKCYTLSQMYIKIIITII